MIPFNPPAPTALARLAVRASAALSTAPTRQWYIDRGGDAEDVATAATIMGGMAAPVLTILTQIVLSVPDTLLEESSRC